MSRLPLIPPIPVNPMAEGLHVDSDLDPAIQQVYEELSRDFGRISPLFQTLANHPLVLRSVWDQIRTVLLQGALPRTIKEMALIAISSRNEINYCINMHSLSLRNLGVETFIIDALLEDPESAPLPELNRAAILFALKASRDPLSVSDEDFIDLQEIGFSRAEILEIVATANLATSLNTLAAVADIPVPEGTSPVS